MGGGGGRSWRTWLARGSVGASSEGMSALVTGLTISGGRLNARALLTRVKYSTASSGRDPGCVRSTTFFFPLPPFFPFPILARACASALAGGGGLALAWCGAVASWLVLGFGGVTDALDGPAGALVLVALSGVRC